MDVFGDLNNQALSPYVSGQENNQAIDLIISRLGKVKSVIIAGEDGETETTILEFLNTLKNYKFQKNEISKIQKGGIWLSYDSDYYIAAKF